VKLFSFWGETVLDPFGGLGSTAVAAACEGRRAACVDQNKTYVAAAKKRVKENGAEVAARCDIRLGDARDLSHLDDNSVGLIVTSPPYWDKADYGGTDADLGALPSYADFLIEMRQVFSECMRVLQPGRKLCVVTANVNQMTD